MTRTLKGPSDDELLRSLDKVLETAETELLRLKSQGLSETNRWRALALIHEIATWSKAEETFDVRHELPAPVEQ